MRKPSNSSLGSSFNHGLDAFDVHGNVLLVCKLIRQHLDGDALQWYSDLDTDLNQDWIQPSPDTLWLRAKIFTKV